MDFSLSDAAQYRITMSRMAAEGMMRPIARQFDEEEQLSFFLVVFYPIL